MPNMTQQQEILLQQARSRVPGLRVVWNDNKGVADVLEGTIVPPQRAETPHQALSSVLQEYGTLLGPSDLSKQAQYVGSRRNHDGTIRVKASQVIDGLPVYDAALLVFCDPKRGVFRVQSSFNREMKSAPNRRLTEDDLLRMARKALAADPTAPAFEKQWRERPPNDPWLVEHFPLANHPTLYLYPVDGGYHPAYNCIAYQPHNWTGVDGRVRHEIGSVAMMVDASTGQTIWMEPTKEGMAYTDVAGDGISTLEDSGAHISRTIHVAQRDGADYVMLNRLHSPEIKTYDAHGTETGLTAKLQADTDLSLDPDDHWLAHTNSTTSTDRRDAQQPEVDCHFYAEQAWEFYHDLGWDGFDDNLWGAPSPVLVSAHIGMDANAYFSRFNSGGRERGYIAFYDGLAAGGNLPFDFMAGDPLIFAHEYQHAITCFGCQTATGAPAYLYGTTWAGAIREAYSDSIACLRYGGWINPRFYPEGAIHTGPDFVHPVYGGTWRTQPFRRIEYPRSTDTCDGVWYCDHYDDRNLIVPADKYRWSTILSHLAYLVGQGGIHERVARPAQLIPVTSIGRLRAAEIYLYALWNYFDTISLTVANGEVFLQIAEKLLDAAATVSGSNRTPEYVMMRRGLYAAGLYPYSTAYVKQTYGGEACMLPWTNDWMLSQPYLGLPNHRWRSPDLFINNGGAAAYEAVAGAENKLFARVRNIGDQQIDNITVRFHFRAYGTNLPASLTSWQTCKDMSGTDCVLTIASIPAGAMNFTNADAPPAASAVNWYLDPALVTPDVDHFCVRATLECAAANHDNDYPYQVQSNVQYVMGDSIRSTLIKFRLENWLNERVPVDIQISHTLPKGFRIRYEGAAPLTGALLEYSEPFNVKYRIMPPAGQTARLLPPFNGTVRGTMKGGLEGAFEGELSEVKFSGALPLPDRRIQTLKISGHLVGRVNKGRAIAKCTFHGAFSGTLNVSTGVLKGKVQGSSTSASGYNPEVRAEIEATLEPLRIVNFTQRVKGAITGGVSLVFQKPKR
jgi:Zn-dependent metalloprotease